LKPSSHPATHSQAARAAIASRHHETTGQLSSKSIPDRHAGGQPTDRQTEARETRNRKKSNKLEKNGGGRLPPAREASERTGSNGRVALAAMVDLDQAVGPVGEGTLSEAQPEDRVSQHIAITWGGSRVSVPGSPPRHPDPSLMPSSRLDGPGRREAGSLAP
jgi:hypothetical protein